MNVTIKKVILIILSILLVAETGLAFALSSGNDSAPVETTAPTATEFIPTEATELPTETIAPTETEAPTEPPVTEPPVTEPKEKHYTLSFAGDCTLGSTKANWNNPNHFVQTIGENYDYPFANVREYFENDDFTIINLEGPLTDETSGAQSKTFAFRGPTAYSAIMTGSSVEAVTLANNHAEDYGKAGYASTKQVLENAGITYVEKDKTAMHTTESGLKIGLYASSFSSITKKGIEGGIAQLRNNGAEIIICAFHWGEEGVYYADGTQQKMAKIAIDAGADIVYGHHPHVLQKIEQYGSGYIFYSLGNFSFGGAALPQDYDTALLQLDVIRDENGKVSLGELTVIPCTYRSSSGQNSFQPTPLEEGTEYDRILKKLGGNFTGGNLKVDYSKLEPKPEQTTPPAPEVPDSGASGESGSGGGSSDAGTSGGSGTGSSDVGTSGGSGTGSSDAGTSGSSGTGSSDAGTSGSSGTGSSDAGTSGGSGTGSSDAGTSGGSGTGSSDAGTSGNSGTGSSDAGTSGGSGTGSSDAGTSGGSGTGSSDAGSSSGGSSDSGGSDGTSE